MRHTCTLLVSRRPERSIDRPCPLVRPVRRCVTTKAMIFSCRKPDQLVSCAPGHVRQPALSVRNARSSELPKKLRRQKECRNRIGTRRISHRDYRWDSSRPHLLTARTHGGVTTVTCTEEAQNARRRPVKHTPLVGASALHGVSGTPSESHLGSTLEPGRAVLTRGVSRRSGSVACIRADASPTEVLAGPMLAPRPTARQTP